MKRINTVVQVKETKELERAVAQELNKIEQQEEKAIASLLVENKKEDESEDSNGVHGNTDTKDD